MLTWIVIFAAAVLAMPLTIELTRKKMTAKARRSAPGEFAQLSQGVTHFQWTGPAEGPVAVCIHGLTTPSFVWQSTAKGLAEQGFRVLTYDLYGRGYSDRPGGLQDDAFFIRQLNDLLEHEDVDDDLTVIGYSMGGVVAAASAAQHPHAVREVILLAPAGMLTVGTGLLRSMVSVPVLGRWLMLALYPGILRRGLKAEADQPTTVPGINTLQQAELDWRGFIPAVHASLKGMLTGNVEPAHRALHTTEVPVMAIWAREDAVIPVSAAELLSQWNPDVTTHILDDVGHNVTFQRTDEILTLISGFTTARR